MKKVQQLNLDLEVIALLKIKAEKEKRSMSSMANFILTKSLESEDE